LFWSPGGRRPPRHYSELFPQLAKDHMSAGFAYYRSGSVSAPQNVKFCKEELPMPVLAPGGSGGMGEHLRSLVEPFAERVDGGAIEDCGHYVMEEQPELLAGRLLDFF
jgi:hypothetical protein